jgi:hypothetical protein
METVTCPRCNNDNRKGNLHCWNCGWKLGTPFANQPSERPTSYQVPKFTPSYSRSYSSSPHDYSALRGIASLCHIIAVGGLILIGAVGLIGGLIAMSDNFIGGVGILISAAISGFLNYIIFKVIAESIFVILDIEANTRRAAASMESVAKRLN